MTGYEWTLRDWCGFLLLAAPPFALVILLIIRVDRWLAAALRRRFGASPKSSPTSTQRNPPK